jgi:hypothetical protein
VGRQTSASAAELRRDLCKSKLIREAIEGSHLICYVMGYFKAAIFESRWYFKATVVYSYRKESIWNGGGGEEVEIILQ